MEEINANLAELAEGYLQQRFDHSVKKVTENILDMNTDPSKVRKVIIEIGFVPDERRDVIDLDISVKEKLVPQKSVTSRMLIDMDMEGNILANEMKSLSKGQTRMNLETGKTETDIGKDVEEVEKAESEKEVVVVNEDGELIDFKNRKKAQG